jgi:rfaE bifunctional protein nucleotidyltransferase chain/domain
MERRTKIHDLPGLVAELDRHSAHHQRIVQCHGVFDLVHVGHIRHLEQAKKLGDVLVVTVTPDRFVNKGAGRPAFPEHLRAEVIASLECVDYVAVNQWPTAVETIKLLRPDVFVKGSEYRSQDTTGQITREEEAIRLVGGELAFTEDITYSSSALINQYLANFPGNVRDYLSGLLTRYSAHDILKPLHNAAQLRVLCVGETILDEYQYCETMGKSGKEPVLAARYVGEDRFAGGILACANHVAGFCDRVDVLTFLGENGDQEAFVRASLKPNVRPLFHYKSNSPTIVKKRFVEKYLSQKLFEVYRINDDALSDAEDEALCARLHKILPDYDVVVVADYGHGMLGPRAIGVLSEGSKFLAVNTQSNAGNNGFNPVSRYPRADYICLAHREFALETRNRHMSQEEMIRQVADKLNCPRVLLTQGKYGCWSWSTWEGLKHVPAFATQVVDRVGAGDALFSLTALCAAQEAPAELVGFLGNVVGAEAVTILGNERSIERVPLYRHVECLLKMHNVAPGSPGERSRASASRPLHARSGAA